MTVANLAVFRDRALLAVDGVLVDAGTGAIMPVQDTKLLALPHAGMVMTTVGAMEFKWSLQRRTSWIRSIDQAPEVLTTMAAAAMAECRNGQHPGPQTIVAAGWCARRGRAVGLVLDSRDGWAPIALDPQFEGAANYWNHPGFRSATLWPTNAEELYAFTRLQLEDLRMTRPDAPAGGTCTVAEITASTITLHVAGDLGWPAPMAAAHEADAQ